MVRLWSIGKRIFFCFMAIAALTACASMPTGVQPSGETFTNSIGQKFVLIPAGTFMMGSPPSEPGRDEGERQHQVTISRNFYMQTTEVTQSQWRALMGNNPSYFSSCGDDCPVEMVSWDDAQEFIRRLNAKEGGYKYRLPTEAEWEYAARAGTTTAYHGPNIDTIAWYWDNSGTTPHPVGLKQANAWGLYDISGNVWEWCQDLVGDYPSGPVTDPSGQPLFPGRVYRGGGWSGDASLLRSADRGWSFPDHRSFNLGFRLARTF